MIWEKEREKKLKQRGQGTSTHLLSPPSPTANQLTVFSCQTVTFVNILYIFYHEGPGQTMSVYVGTTIRTLCTLVAAGELWEKGRCSRGHGRDVGCVTWRLCPAPLPRAGWLITSLCLKLQAVWYSLILGSFLKLSTLDTTWRLRLVYHYSIFNRLSIVWNLKLFQHNTTLKPIRYRNFSNAF